MDKIFCKNSLVSTVNREPFFVGIPFFDKKTNENLKSDLTKLAYRFYPQISLKIIFQNNFSIKSFFPFKDRVDTLLQSDVVYKYSCSHCNATYVGETARHLHTRISEHRGVSHRTGHLLNKTPNSNIFKHYLDTGHDVLPSQFEVVCNISQNLKLTESIVIHQLKPSLNENLSSVKLNIV